MQKLRQRSCGEMSLLLGFCTESCTRATLHMITVRRHCQKHFLDGDCELRHPKLERDLRAGAAGTIRRPTEAAWCGLQRTLLLLT